MGVVYKVLCKGRKINVLDQKFNFDSVKCFLENTKEKEQTSNRIQNRLQKKEEGEKCTECERHVNALKEGTIRYILEKNKYRKHKCDNIKQ